MVADADMDAGVEKAEFFEHGQQQAAQRDLACGDAHGAGLQRAALGNFRFAGFDMLERDAHVGVQALALRRQFHAAVCAQKQWTPEFAFQVFDGARHVRLVI